MIGQAIDAADATDEGARDSGARSEGGSEQDIELALKLWIVFSRAFIAVSDLNRRDVAATGLTPGEFAVLEVLHHKGPLLLGEVREKILVSSGGITYLVDRLTEKGLVERRVCETDRRASYAALTGKGTELISTIFPGHARMIARAFGGLDAEEKAEAIALVRKAGLHAAELVDAAGE